MSITPGIVSSKKSQQILISNPNEEDIEIFCNQPLAIAQPAKNDGQVFVINTSPQSPRNRIDIDPEFKVNLDNCDINETQRANLKSLIEEFSDIFSKSQYDLGNCNVQPQKILTTTEVPPKPRILRTPVKYREQIKKHIDQLIASGVLVESDTPWVSSLVIVQKKDGGLRPCIDFRKLNELTIPDHYPMPRLDTILNKIGNCNYYTSLDMASGYMQIPLNNEASRKCGVITEDRVYQCTRMPFGLKNATGMFMRAMNAILGGLDKHVTAYVDDILIHTQSIFQEHLEVVRKVFTRLREYNMKLFPKKCVFAQRKIVYLGHSISGSGYTPANRNLEAIKNPEC